MARLRYKGGGFIVGIPASDLSQEQVDKFGLERLLATGLYEDLQPPKPKKEPKPPKYEEEVEVLADELEQLDEVFDDHDTEEG